MRRALETGELELAIRVACELAPYFHAKVKPSAAPADDSGGGDISTWSDQKLGDGKVNMHGWRAAADVRRRDRVPAEADPQGHPGNALLGRTQADEHHADQIAGRLRSLDVAAVSSVRADRLTHEALPGGEQPADLACDVAQRPNVSCLTAQRRVGYAVIGRQAIGIEEWQSGQLRRPSERVG